jgi:hypothetical protein
MNIEEGINLVYIGDHRRSDIERVEYFLGEIPLRITRVYAGELEKQKTPTLGIRIEGADISIRPLEECVEYRGIELFDGKRYKIKFKQVGQPNQDGASVEIWEQPDGLRLILYGKPTSKI